MAHPTEGGATAPAERERAAAGVAMEIAQGAYAIGQLEGLTAYLSGRVHAFLLDDGTGQLTLIDTLWDEDGHLVLEQIRRIGRRVTDVKHIVLTHGHRSHVGGLAQLKQLSGATIYAHEWEADIIAGDRKAQAVTLRPRPPYRVYTQQLGLSLGVGKHPPCPVDRTVRDGDMVGPVQVLHAPGHTPGHLAFFWADRRLLIAGDAISTWPEFDAGWQAFNLNPTQHRQTIRRLAELDARAVGVGHGRPITAGAGEHLRSLVRRYEG